ncbi:MAG: hypothetical protein V3U51_01255, partial [Thermoplasmata archaeon]
LKLDEIPEQDYLKPAVGRYTILMNHEAASLMVNLDEHSQTFRFRSLPEEQYADLIRFIQAISMPRTIGPFNEIEFSERFFGE